MQSPRVSRRLNKDRKRGITQRKSCDTCHRSKTKCDRKRPTCSTCTIFNRKCTYKHRDEHGAPSPKSLKLNDSTSDVQLAAAAANTLPEQKACNEDTPSSSDSSDKAHDTSQSFVAWPTSDLPSNDLLSDSYMGLNLPSVSIQASMPLLAQDCGWCLKPDCPQCQYVLSADSSESGISTQQHESNSIARALLEAMASSSDQDSSTILAAIRIGTPWIVIHNAIVSDIYAQNGLAFALEVSKAALAKGDASTGAEDIESKNYHPNRKIFDHLRYQPQSPTEDQPDFVGTVRHRRLNSRQGKKPPFLRHRTSSCETGGLSRDIRIPVWSVLPLRQADDTDDPFGAAFAMIKAELATGLDLAEYCGEHAFLSVFVNPQAKERVPRLSQVVADLLSSMLPHETSPSVTNLAIFWLHWCLWAWMLAPSPESYERLPPMIRPTPWQICAPHTFLYNFAIIPALRDYLCREPMKINSWVTEAASTIQCSWPKTTLHALSRHSVTKALDLSPECKRFASQPENWSFGPSVRAHLPNIDSLITIRTPQQD